MTPDQAISSAKRGELRPLYLLLGEERYLRAHVLQALKLAALAGGVPGLNEEQFTAGEASVGRILDVARTSPMMSPRRWVLIKQLERWEEQEAKGKSSAFDELVAYAKSPVPSTVLVLVADKLDQRKKFVTLAKQDDFLVTCPLLSSQQLPAWLLAEAGKRQHLMTHSIAELVGELAGPDLSGVADALERLSLYVGEGQPITVAAVNECITTLRPTTVWELLNAVNRRNVGDALQLLGSVFDPRDRGLKLLGLLAWSVRQLLRFHAATRQGQSPEQAAKAAGAPPFKANELAKLARQTTAHELETWLTILARTDLALKGGSKRPAKAILEDAVIALCSRSA